MDVSKISTGPNPPYEVNAVIEIPQGGVPVKYELDKESGAMMVDRFLHTAMFYPANYGFIPNTLSDDGDPAAGRDRNRPKCAAQGQRIGRRQRTADNPANIVFA